MEGVVPRPAVEEEEVVGLARTLIDIESVTGNEGQVAHYVRDWLLKRGWVVELQEVVAGRWNVYGRTAGGAGKNPRVVVNSHLDTVPPFFASSVDATHVRGRGACDTKSLIAAQLLAVQQLVEEDSPGKDDIALLYVVGEETDHVGITKANELGIDPRYLMVKGQKGYLGITLRGEGIAAHSAYPERGKSAIEPLLDVLQDLRADVETWPHHPVLGKATMNIGTIQGGLVPNIVPESAAARLSFRIVDPMQQIIERVTQVVAGRVKIEVEPSMEAIELEVVEGYPTDVVGFGTDIPHFRFSGRAILWGAGSIRDAHGADEKIAIADLVQAVQSYKHIISTLASRPS
ncbi:peptidase dimerization domain containing protein [Acanthamoeba castellanii str. Neff]|uniref:Peptidase dimerization domain containing protein n=1 Tax=Acanthamoeba castellanii (strain ATCC 30010 / Neff) TaxID=1257118 RepID=L8H2E1_ACACF|nr:peptidase dimerization domain containing protein [Acanthamoeba castellanii str. Neff]ELR18923.1 peptidase dimerization domain containing protein [Acanthamoeba castellanii str. Neff]